MTEWERCRPWIEAALIYADGTHSIEDIAAGIASGAAEIQLNLTARRWLELPGEKRPKP